jgi:hypothetical protein
MTTMMMMRVVVSITIDHTTVDRNSCSPAAARRGCALRRALSSDYQSAA